MKPATKSRWLAIFGRSAGAGKRIGRSSYPRALSTAYKADRQRVWVSEQRARVYRCAGLVHRRERAPSRQQQFVDQLLIAAMLLDLDPEVDSANTTFAGFDLYSKRLLSCASLSECAQGTGTASGQHVSSSINIIAPLVAELVLGGMAPEYLCTGLAVRTLRLGTPGWVVLTQAVHFAEASSRVFPASMTYQHLLGFSRLSEAQPRN